MKEKVLEAFHELGFQMEELEDHGYCFGYEGQKYLYSPNESDDEFLSISIPCIYELTDDNFTKYIALTERINSTLKYVKAYHIANYIWLFYEREMLSEDEDLMLVVSRMILHLEAAVRFVAEAMEEMDNEDEETEEDSAEESEDESDTDEYEDDFEDYYEDETTNED